MSKAITLIIGGLGVKGISSIGVLQSLSEHKIKIKKIIASGISSLAGVQFALGRDLGISTERLNHFFTENNRYLWGLEQFSGVVRSRRRRIIDSFSYFLSERLYCRENLKKVSILQWELIETELNEFFGDITFDALDIQLAISTVDLKRGEEVLLDQGRLVDSLKASIAFPGLFPPVTINDRELVSSTLYCELPLGSIRNADSPSIAIDILSDTSVHQPNSVLEIIAQADELRSVAIKRGLITKADVVFRLETLRRFRWGSYQQIPQLVIRAREEMNQILNAWVEPV